MEFTIEEFKQFELSPGAYILLYALITNDTELMNKIVFISLDKKELQDKGFIKLAEDEEIIPRQKLIDLQNKLNPEPQFIQFWDKYHEVTGLKKSDKDAAEKYWKKLTKKEKVLAINNIDAYYDNLPIYAHGKPVKKARTYLGDKNFNDEFEVKQTKSSLNKMI